MKKTTKLVNIRPEIVQHKVFELEHVGDVDPEHTLVLLAMRYLKTEVEGVQSPHTFAAKRRDLAGFIHWYSGANGHVRIEQWMPRDTQGYLNHLQELGRAPATINRVLSTLRRFARWCHDQHNTPFQLGLPTKGIKERGMDEPDAKKLDNRVVHQLFKAADALVLTEKRKNARPRRNKAILGLLYFTGLRVSELTRLKRSQYDGKYLQNVKRKGNNLGNVYLSTRCRGPLEDYLEAERVKDDPEEALEALFLPSSGPGPLNRTQINRILWHITEEANKHRKDGDAISLHPHQLRHTFGSIYREKTGSDTETAAALGHASLKYVGRYVRKTQAEREAVLEEIFEPCP